MITLNWGTRIFFLYTAFVLLIVTLVWKSTQTKFDLVSDDYYQQEVGFQKTIDARTNTAHLAQRPVAGVTAEAILIFFPQDFAGKGVSADVQLYSPANAAMDKKFSALGLRDGQISITRKSVAPGRYIMKLSWVSEGKEYYQEMPLNLLGK
jgi:hypothetical protein